MHIGWELCNRKELRVLLVCLLEGPILVDGDGSVFRHLVRRTFVLLRW